MMNNRLDRTLKILQLEKRKGLSIFLTAGYPSIDITQKLVLELEKSGVDFFEIGFPFSDPIADGPTIQRSTQAALDKGMNWNRLLGLARSIRKKSLVPLVLMSYANPLYSRGWKRSAEELAKAGFDGLIIPDLIPEESNEAAKFLEKAGIRLIYLCAPTSPLSRMKALAKKSTGFIYCVSVTGVTGSRKKLPVKDITHFVKRLKLVSSLPTYLGFGISQPDHIRSLEKGPDGFIIGSALTKIIEENKGQNALIRAAKNFIIKITRAIDRLNHK